MTCSNCKHLHRMGRQLYGVCVCVCILDWHKNVSCYAIPYRPLSLLHQATLNIIDLHPLPISSACLGKNSGFVYPPALSAFRGCPPPRRRRSQEEERKAEILIFCVSHTKRKPEEDPAGGKLGWPKTNPHSFPTREHTRHFCKFPDLPPRAPHAGKKRG